MTGVGGDSTLSQQIAEFTSARMKPPVVTLKMQIIFGTFAGGVWRVVVVVAVVGEAEPRPRWLTPGFRRHQQQTDLPNVPPSVGPTDVRHLHEQAPAWIQQTRPLSQNSSLQLPEARQQKPNATPPFFPIFQAVTETPLRGVALQNPKFAKRLFCK